MSDYGVSIENSNGLSIVSSDYSSFEVLSSGVLTTCRGMLGHPGNPIGTRIPLAPDELLFVKLDALTQLTLVTPTHSVFNIPAGNVGIAASRGAALLSPNWCLEVSLQIPYFVAKPSTAITSTPSGYGMELYNSAGQLTFSSNKPTGIYRGSGILTNSIITYPFDNPNHPLRIYAAPKGSQESYYICANGLLPYERYYDAWSNPTGTRVVVNKQLKAYAYDSTIYIMAFHVVSSWENTPYTSPQTFQFFKPRTLLVVSKYDS